MSYPGGPPPPGGYPNPMQPAGKTTIQYYHIKQLRWPSGIERLSLEL